MAQARDLTGYISGNLIVIERDYDYPKTLKSSHPSAYWKCKCGCGNIVTIKSSRLTTDDPRQKATSCKECANKKRYCDISGQRFDRLIALEIAKDKSYNNDSHAIWKCLCDCGNITYVPINHLKSGATKSCGCLAHDLAIDDLTGQKFGKLTVLKQVSRPENVATISRAYWLCRCDCGSEIIVRSSALKDINNGIQSCGCIKSKGEQTIIKILQDNNIVYEYQKSFDNCRYPITNRPAKFDFYINNDFLLEFDGRQHFDFDDKGWNTEEHLKAQIERDEFKNNWCKNNKIILKRIPYQRLNSLTLNDILGDNFIYKEEE